jgi:hypothetical protein
MKSALCAICPCVQRTSLLRIHFQVSLTSSLLCAILFAVNPAFLLLDCLPLAVIFFSFDLFGFSFRAAVKWCLTYHKYGALVPYKALQGLNSLTGTLLYENQEASTYRLLQNHLIS